MPAELLKFTPAYCIVGIYRIVSDKYVRTPVWDKLQHGLIRGAAAAAVWTFFTYEAQHGFVKFFLLKTPRYAGLHAEEIYGVKISVVTYATFIFMSTQITGIIRFFLANNLRIAKERAWDQVVASRGKSKDFWGPYIEEWEKPPQVQIGGFQWQRWVGFPLARIAIRYFVVTPLQALIPLIGIPITALMRAVSTSRTLHSPYFIAKKMTPLEIATYMEERKLDYWAFGFTAALLEMVPILGLFFSISNRVGAAMWAFDLEKRQHLFASGDKKPKPPRVVELDDGSKMEFKPSSWAPSGKVEGAKEEGMVGSWLDVTKEDLQVEGVHVPHEGVVAAASKKGL